jgi:hypothetical protein
MVPRAGNFVSRQVGITQGCTLKISCVCVCLSFLSVRGDGFSRSSLVIFPFLQKLSSMDNVGCFPCGKLKLVGKG